MPKITFNERPKLNLKYQDVWDNLKKIEGKDPMGLTVWQENCHDEFLYNEIQFRVSNQYKIKKLQM